MPDVDFCTIFARWEGNLPPPDRIHGFDAIFLGEIEQKMPGITGDARITFWPAEGERKTAAKQAESIGNSGPFSSRSNQTRNEVNHYA